MFYEIRSSGIKPEEIKKGDDSEPYFLFKCLRWSSRDKSPDFKIVEKIGLPKPSGSLKPNFKVSYFGQL